MTADGKTYTFRGKTFAEAIQKVTRTLGKDAYIIEKREVGGKRGALSGILGGNQEIEIVAAASVPQKPEREQPKTTLLQKTYCSKVRLATPKMTPIMTPLEQPSERQSDSASLSGSGLSERFESIEKLLDSDKRMIEEMRNEMRSMFSLQARGGLPCVSDSLMEAYRKLVDNDVADDVARELVERMQRQMPEAACDPESVRAALCESISRLIETTGPVTLKENGPTIVALVGPTGVGKTTTILKLAFDFVVKRKKRVGVITEDVCRPGAREQLRSLDQFLGLPVVAADGAAHALQEIRHMQDRDLILIDTAGRCPRNSDKLSGLASYLEEVEPDEIHLVLSSESAERNVIDAIERFRVVGYDRLVLSKLDEAASYGLILNVASRIAERLSYITTGQDYMETFAAGEPLALARLVMGEDRIEPYGGGGDS